MEWFGYKQSTRISTNNTWSKFPIFGKLYRARPLKSYNNTENDNYKFSDRHNINIYPIAKKLCLLLATTVTVTPAYAADVGGVSATANPIANSSGSVTNQAIQVLQGPYITNTYGGGIQCQGATMNITPYVTGTGAFKRPWERYYNDPVYDIHGADDDGQIDNPGNILYYVPTRTGQQEIYNLSAGLSATWSRPLDKKLQDQCKEAAAANIDLMQQAVANKRLDFELARLKNCGELKKAGIMFHPKSPYASVCADVMLVNPAGVVAPHQHNITSSKPSEVPSKPDSDLSEQEPVPEQKDASLVSHGWRLPWQSPSSQQVSPPSKANPLGVLQVGQKLSPQ